MISPFFFNVLIFAAGIGLLYAGAEFLVRGSSNLARSLGVKPIIVGLTVVAFGTSMPEFMVSMFGAITGAQDISVGNILGSNIANIGLILGVSGLMAPLAIKYSTVREQLLILFVGSLIFCLTAYNGISRMEGIIYLVLILSYIVFLIRHNGKSVKNSLPEKNGSIPRNVIFTLLGITGLLFGSRWIIRGAGFIAAEFGISEMVIGVSIVAVGTSLPELAASVMAQIKNESDISVGNIIGSNLFNMFFVGGGTAIVNPLSINKSIYGFEVPVMLFFSFLLFPVIFVKKGVSRLMAAVFLTSYVAFIAISYLMM